MSEKDDFERERELFHRACIVPHEERAGFLDETCGDDPHLRARLEALLAAELSWSAVRLKDCATV